MLLMAACIRLEWTAKELFIHRDIFCSDSTFRVKTHSLTFGGTNPAAAALVRCFFLGDVTVGESFLCSLHCQGMAGAMVTAICHQSLVMTV